MRLLIDAGNTRVKWAFAAANDSLSGHGEVIHRGRDPGVALAVLRTLPERPTRILVSNVAGTDMEKVLRELAAAHFEATLELVRVLPGAGGVQPGYEEPWRLGVDRWLALLGARASWDGALCIADAGTAFTLDALDAQGVHLGGLIAAGLVLMQQKLLGETSDIAERAEDEVIAVPAGFFGRSTAEAVASGALHALAALTERAVEETERRVGGTATLLLSGGDAQILRGGIRRPAELAPDLVLRGLAALVPDTEEV